MSKNLTNPEDEAKELLPRYRILYLGLMLAALTIFSRLWFLQIVSGNELRQFSERNRVKETKIAAPRGLMLDREGRVLVENLPGFEVTITPQYATRLEETAEAVGEILEIPGKQIVTDVRASRRRDGPFRPFRVKDNLNLDQVYKLKLIRWDHPGLNINETVVRHYSLSSNGAQLFGYVGEISRDQLTRYNKKYEGVYNFEQGDIIGKSGLEEVWERNIRGEGGVSYVEVDARGREATTDFPSFLGLKAYDPKSGQNLVLTIDRDIQVAAFNAMNRDDAIGPRVGALVAMQSNGEILAWVNMPSFDPNQFATGISADLWRSLVNDPFKPLRNKVIQDHYAPGSTFKPFVALAALQEKVIGPNTIVHAPGVMMFARRPYHDTLKQGHGHINVYDSLERSSNIFYYKLGIQLGIDRMYEYIHLLGIGKRTEVGLQNEVSGQMPSREWKERAVGEDWQPGENLSTAIGQGFVLSTPLQMALAYNTIGMEGEIYKPLLVKRIIDQNNQVLKEFEPQLVDDISLPKEGRVHIDKKNFKVVKEGMRRVVNGERGTARGSRIYGVDMSGKTGTAQVRAFSADTIYDKCELGPLTQRHHGWFIGYAPADKPQITVAVLAEHACSGSRGAAPVVRDVILAYFQKHHPELVKRHLVPKIVAVPPTALAPTAEAPATREETQE